MKKLKLLLTAFALMGGVISVNAQTDVTSDYITNPSFESDGAKSESQNDGNVTGWKFTGSADKTVHGTSNGSIGWISGVSATNGTYFLAIRHRWESSSQRESNLTQTITIPKGKYTLKADYQAFRNQDGSPQFMLSVNANGGALATQSGSFTAKDNTTFTDAINKKFSVDFEAYTPENTIKFYVKAKQNIQVAIDNVQLFYNSNYTSELESAIARARLLYTRTSNAALNTAITNAQGVLDGADNTVDYQTTIDDEVTALRSAISTAYASVTLLTGEDVTFLLENADFESGSSVAGGICTYDYDCTTNNTYASQMQAVEGWTIPANGNGKAAGVLSFGSDVFFGGSSYKPTSVTSQTSEAKALSIVAVWTATAQYKQNVTLPAGRYVIEVPVYNLVGGTTAFTKNLIGFVENGGTEHLAAATTYTVNTWTTEHIEFDLNSDTEGYMSVGYQSANAGSGNMPHLLIDNVKITFTDAANAYAATVSSATTTYNDPTYACVTGSEKAALKALIDANTSGYGVSDYFTGIDNINAAVATFTTAKSEYDKFDVEKASALSMGVDENEVVRPASASADDLLTAMHGLYELEDAAANSGYPVNATTLFGSWTKQNLGTKDDEHWSGNTVTYYDKWDANGFTSSITSTVTLPAGRYVFKLAARAQSGGINGAFNMSVKIGDADAVYKDFVAKDNTGKGIDTSGRVNYGDGTFANDNNGRGWEWRFIGFELDAEASVEMKGYAQIYGGKWVGFTDATLLTTSDNVAVLKNLLSDEITAANAIYASGANVGTGVFQYPSSAASTFNTAINTTAQGVYDNASATSGEVSDAIDALKAAEETYIQSINAPTDGKRYCIKVATAGHAKFGNAWVVNPGVTNANNPTGYTILASAAPADYMNQAFVFTKVSGNTYNISIERPEGTVYLTYGSLNGSAAGWNKMQIQATTESAKKGEFKIVATNTANVFKVYNTEQGDFIDCEDGESIYTNNTISKELFTVEEASQASVTINIPAAQQYATAIFPFAPSLPSGVKAYSCEEAPGNVLTLEEVAEPAANKPYILEATSGYSGDALQGWGSASAGTYTEGMLTGVYTDTAAPDGSYVLANINEKVAFYLVDNTDKPTVGAYRCYLTAPDGARALYFPGNEGTGIEAVNALTSGDVKIFNASGAQIPALQKGMNIVKQSNGKSYKVIVK